MPVVNENRQSKKYFGLSFVEFLDLLARLAVVGFEDTDTIEHKVYWLLQLAWSYMQALGEWQESDYVL